MKKKKAKKFEDLKVWQESTALAVELYQHLKDCKDFGLKDQMQRSTISISSNITENFDRQTHREFIQFLYRGLCAELRTQLHIAQSVNVFSTSVAEALLEKTCQISAISYKPIQYRKDYHIVYH